MRLAATVGVALALTMPVHAAELCATDEQAADVRAFYAQNPGTQPAIVAARLQLPEAIVLSALDDNQAVSVSGDMFTAVWEAMTEWDQATFMIMKGGSVFEILSGIGPGKPSTRSSYYNIEYVEALRGHLRPDEYRAIYAVAIPQDENVVNRGIIVLDDAGASVFAAFISGDSMPTTPAEIAKFDKLMAMLGKQPRVCP